MDTRIEPGHCWVCGEPVHEIISWKDGHVQRVGARLPEAVPRNILLANGRPVRLTLHKDCPIEVKALWKVLVAAELESRRQVGPSGEVAHQNQLRLLKPPLGLI